MISGTIEVDPSHTAVPPTVVVREIRSALPTLSLHARSLDIPTNDHPNKMPFTGILTRIDEPSDAAPEGSGGKRVTITMAAARRALDSLLGMAVDYTPGMDGHDPQAKIGVITGAEIVDNAIHIKGFIYGADFPEVSAEIRANKHNLGFSFEARDLFTSDPEADPIPIVECVFTGAAILLKDKAAYHSTSINAARQNVETEILAISKADESAKGIIDMSKEELAALLAEAMKPLSEKIDAQAAKIAELEKLPGKVDAANACMAAVEPHASRLEDHAERMEKDGIGGHPSHGHVAVLRHMAGCMRADAAMGRMPHVYEGAGWIGAAAAKTEKVDVDAAVQAAVEKVSADFSKQFAELKASAEKTEVSMKDEKAALETVIADLKAQADKAAATAPTAPQRKTLNPSQTALLAKAGVEVPGKEGEKIDVKKLDAALRASGTSERQRFELKTSLAKAGLLD